MLIRFLRRRPNYVSSLSKLSVRNAAELDDALEVLFDISVIVECVIVCAHEPSAKLYRLYACPNETLRRR
jgi:hypothetical protein